MWVAYAQSVLHNVRAMLNEKLCEFVFILNIHESNVRISLNMNIRIDFISFI